MTRHGPPRKITIVRHAEKPPLLGSPAGVKEDGSRHRHSLIVRGWQRAGALVPFFCAPWDPAIESPTTLYAPPSHGGEGDHGRPFETIAPLAERLNMQIDQRFVLGQESELVADVLGRAGVVLIAWEHDRIPRIVNAILQNDAAAPQKWPDDRFDLAWICDLQPGGGYRFSQRPQLLLSGDRPEIVPSG